MVGRRINSRAQQPGFQSQLDIFLADDLGRFFVSQFVFCIMELIIYLTHSFVRTKYINIGKVLRIMPGIYVLLLLLLLVFIILLMRVPLGGERESTVATSDPKILCTINPSWIFMR